MIKSILKSTEFYFVAVVIVFILVLLFIPTGFEREIYPNTTRAKALILEVDNSNVRSARIIQEGEQKCKILILNGKFKGYEANGINRLTGKLELDKIFNEGDKAFVVIDYNNDSIHFVNILDHYRLNIELILFIAFVLLLIIFAGWIGVKSVLSFILTVLLLWKILLPSFLKGLNPIFISLLVVTIMTTITLFLVAGLNKKSLVAILGSLSGSYFTCILAIIFGSLFKIHGAVMPFSENLLYSGYSHLRLSDIFIAGIFIASAGAIMDLSMDISVSVFEIYQKKPDLTIKEAIFSGFTIGRAVIGTMTTTLLLAYSGGYVAMFMVFMAQGTPILNILNLNYVSSEILHTLVGSFGLVTVAPLTAILAGVIFHKNTFKSISNGGCM
ncbi:UNVERIFIED_CONTAM: putative membrane protein [Acetivibrio alkalicellulosi]